MKKGGLVCEFTSPYDACDMNDRKKIGLWFEACDYNYEICVKNKSDIFGWQCDCKPGYKNYGGLF